MKPHPLAGLLSLLLAVATPAATAHATVILKDDFTGSTLNTTVWYTATGGGQAVTPTVDGVTNVQFAVNNAAANGSHRSLIASKTSDFDLFGERYRIDVDITSLDRGAAPGGGTEGLYFLIGQPLRSGGELHRLYDNIEMQGIALTFSRTATGTLTALARAFEYNGLDINNPRSSVVSSSANKTLNGLPTSVSWYVDGGGNQYTVSIAGTTFTDGSTTLSGNFGTLDAGDFGLLFNGESSPRGVYFAAGLSAGGTTDAISAQVDSITVSLVPEPAPWLLLLTGAFLLLPVLARRRTRHGLPHWRMRPT